MYTDIIAANQSFDKSRYIAYTPPVFSMNPIDGIRKASIHRALFGTNTVPVTRSSTVRSIIIFTNNREKLSQAESEDYPTSSPFGEIAINDARSTDIYRFGWQISDKLADLGHTLHTFFVVAGAMVSHFINVLLYQAYMATARAYAHVTHLPAYIQELQYQTITFLQALRQAEIRDLWILERKVRVRTISQECGVLARRLYAVLRVHYMAVFVTVCLAFLALSGVHAQTNHSSFLEQSAANNFAASRTVLTADSNRGGASAVSDMSFASSTTGTTFISSHVVKTGDTLTFLSTLYGVKPEIIAFNNNLAVDAALTPGSSLFIPAADAYIYFAQQDVKTADLARIYKVGESDLVDLNPAVQAGGTITKDTLVFVPISSVDQIKQLNADESERVQQAQAKEQAQKAAEETARRRVAAISGVSYSVVTNIPANLKPDIDFAWPTDSRNVSCGWYCYPGHTAIDVQDTGESNPAIYASAGGYVTEVRTGDSPRSGNGYGNYVVISHGDGYRTLYAHLSQVDVSVGETVGKGARIGSMGNTGNVWGITGIHLHFEIRKDSQIFNPISILP